MFLRLAPLARQTACLLARGRGAPTRREAGPLAEHPPSAANAARSKVLIRKRECRTVRSLPSLPSRATLPRARPLTSRAKCPLGFLAEFLLLSPQFWLFLADKTPLAAV